MHRLLHAAVAAPLVCALYAAGATLFAAPAEAQSARGTDGILYQPYRNNRVVFEGTGEVDNIYTSNRGTDIDPDTPGIQVRGIMYSTTGCFAPRRPGTLTVTARIVSGDRGAVGIVVRNNGALQCVYAWAKTDADRRNDSVRVRATAVLTNNGTEVDRFEDTFTVEQRDMISGVGVGVGEGVGEWAPLDLTAPPPRTFTAGAAINVPALPAASGGSGHYIYALTGRGGAARPSWIRFDSAARRMSGTPQSAAGAVTLDYTVDDGNASVTQSFTVTVNAAVDSTAPTVRRIERQAPSDEDTNANSLTFRVTFSEAVEDVGTTDFAVTAPGGGTATTARVTGAQARNAADTANATQPARVFRVTVSGGNLGSYDGTVGLGFATDQDIADAAGNALADTTPSGADETWTLDNTAPTPTLSASPVNHDGSSTSTVTIDFGEAVNGFTAGDVTVSGGIRSNFSGSDGDARYTLTVTPGGNADITVSVAANVATDRLGHANLAAGDLVVGYGICGRTQQVQDAILRATHGVSDCGSVTAAHLSGFTGAMNLSNRGITSLQAGDFAGLTGMPTLWLSRNTGLTSLPEGVFSGLTSLINLTLDGNTGLTSLPESVFAGLTRLVRLRLDGNTGLTSLPEGVFSGLASLSELRLYGNTGLTSVPEGVFSGLTGLSALWMHDTGVTSLPEGVFSGLASLSDLRLYGNTGLTSLSEGVFSGLTSLRSLQLNDNTGLTSLPAGVFSGLTSLSELRLEGNTGLTSLPESVFSGLTGLSTLWMHNAGLTSLPAGVFSGLTSLSKLRLEGNTGLTSLPAGVFSGLTSLSDLRLHGNTGLTSLPAGVFSGLASLSELRLYGNTGLTSLPAGVFSGLTSLHTLYLDSTGLTSLPAGVFAGLTRLDNLWLSSTPGAPFTLTMEPDLSEDGTTLVVRVAEGAPFAMTTSLTVTGGTATVDSATVNSVTVPAGATESTAITITPSQPGGAVTVTLGDAPAVPSGFRGIQTAVGGPVPPTDTTLTQAPGDGLQARFGVHPAWHTGMPFWTELHFSAEPDLGYKDLRDKVLEVTGGRITQAERLAEGSNLGWRLTVEPEGLGDVGLELPATESCGAEGAVCTSDGRRLERGIAWTVEGPPAFSVSDAEADEDAGAVLAFEVSLSRQLSAEAQVDVATRDGTATAGSDYEAVAQTLVFAPGETLKTVEVVVLDDAHDEGEETMTLVLSNAEGALIDDGEGTGTIVNTDAIPKAWVARFGRTVTGQVLDAVEARLAAPREAGGRMTLAGYALATPGRAGGSARTGVDAGTAAQMTAGDRAALAALGGWTDGTRPGRSQALREPRDGGPEPKSLDITRHALVTGTAFTLSAGSAEGGGFGSLWGRGAVTRFDGREDALTLDGEVTTGFLGADWAAERWTAGLALGHSAGAGGYRDGECAASAPADGTPANDGQSVGCGGRIEATLTGLYPYAGLDVTERLSVWLAGGHGTGGLTVIPDGSGAIDTDLATRMGAAGTRIAVREPEGGAGLSLALKGDGRFTRTTSDAARAPDGGNLAKAEADVWLLRFGVEGSRPFALGGSGTGDGTGASLTPSFEVGVRRDGGDAETGFGADMGGGLALAAPERGLRLDLKGRALVAHEAPGFREWGASAGFGFDPRPATERGLSLSLTQAYGATPSGGMDALLDRETLSGFAGNDAGSGRFEASSRLSGQLGYGLPAFGGGFTGTPNVGFGLSSDGARDWRLGWRLTPARPGASGFEVTLDATRRESANADAEHGVTLRGGFHW